MAFVRIMRFLPLVALLFAGCASKVVDNQLNEETANSRAIEQVRMRYIADGRAASDRGAEIAVPSEHKSFNLAAMNPNVGKSTYGDRASRTSTFNFTNSARTKPFSTGNFNAKEAYLGDAKYSTKSATVTKRTWFPRLLTRTKTYDTRTARDAEKAAPIRGLPDGERPFLNKGRRQADLDRNGQRLKPEGRYGDNDLGPAYTGELQEMSIDDVKKLLNKN